MGFRLNIEHKGIEYGDDHKLYGYAPLEVLSSFNIIFPEIKKQWGIPEESDPDIVYMAYMCVLGATDDLILDEVTFSKFADAYLIDFEKRYGNKDLSVVYYMDKLKHSSGEKTLYWC